MEDGKTNPTRRGEVGSRGAARSDSPPDRAKELYGETIPMDAAIGSEKRVGNYLCQPIGDDCGNQPLKLRSNLGRISGARAGDAIPWYEAGSGNDGEPRSRSARLSSTPVSSRSD